MSESPEECVPLPSTDAETAEAKAALLLRLRGAGIRDVRVLRAFELVSRQAFVPPGCGALAARDVAIPIACGQSMAPPLVVARMVEALAVMPGHRVLEIGAGSGFVTALLAQLAVEVTSVERFQSLVGAAADRLARLDCTNAAVVWADGLEPPQQNGTFDRIIVHALLLDVPAALLSRLRDGGVIICARPTGEGQSIVRMADGVEGLTETLVCPCRLPPIVPGLARAL